MNLERNNFENKPPKIDIFKQKLETHINELLSSYQGVGNLGEGFNAEILELKTKLNNIKNGNIDKSNLIQIKYDLKTESPYFLDERKDKKYLSMGQIVSNTIWDKEYYMSFDSFNETKDKGEVMYDDYFKTLTEKETLKILNKYIYEKEILKNSTKDAFKMNAYKNSREEGNKSIENTRSGIIAEKLVRSFLTRIAIDNKDLEIEISEVNIYQDIEYKIDFLIKNKHINRGVKVDSDEYEEEKVRKIQFTINASRESEELKKKQLEIADDVILVKMPELEVSKTIKKWKEDKTHEYSPDKYFDTETKREILEKMLKGFVSDEALDKIIKSAII